jgi:hypothetical protein
VQKCPRLSLSGTDLSDPEVTQNLFDIMGGMGYVLRWIDISYCHIPPKAMHEISGAFASCERLDYLNIAGNLIVRQKALRYMAKDEPQAKKKAGKKEPALPADEEMVLATVENICALIEHQGC